MSQTYDKLMKCYKSMKKKVKFKPEVALILGSGLGDYVKQVQVEATVAYSDIEGFQIGRASCRERV